MLTVEGSFASYLETVFAGIPIGPAQISELKKAYYGGAAWVFLVMDTWSRTTSPRAFNARVEALKTELMDFAGQLPPSKGGPTDEPVAESKIILPPNLH
jgi:hypothetical protein